MALTSYSILSTVWTKITAAGESGTCWKKTGGVIVVSHTDQETAATLPLANTNVTLAKSKRVPLDNDNNDVMSLPADNSDDIFYALALNSDASNNLAVDVI